MHIGFENDSPKNSPRNMKGRPASSSLKLRNSRLPIARRRPMNNIKYVGMDVHKSITVIVVLNELGQSESRSQIKTKGENICDFFRGISGKVEVVFEGSCVKNDDGLLKRLR